MLARTMSAARIRRSRAAYLELLDDYRKAAGRTWNEIDAATGVVPSTREQWFNGKTQTVPLVGIVRIARALNVPADELFAAVLDNQVEENPTIAERVTRLERIVLNRASDAEVLELERQLGEVLADSVSQADEALQSREG